MSHHQVRAPSVRLKDVSYAVDGRHLVRDVSLSAEPEQVVGLVGPNGSGKTTLLRVVYRVLRPTSGQVLVGYDGVWQDVWKTTPRTLARLMAAVPQDPPGDFELSTRDIVAMGRSPHKRAFDLDSADDHRLVMTSLELVGAAELADRGLATLSGGERQRVLLARALAQEPGLLVLDEPTNHLDIRHQLDVLALLRRLRVTALVALHDLNLAARFCDRLCLLDNGRRVVAGSPPEVLTPELLADVYGVDAEVAPHPRTGSLNVVYRSSSPPPRPRYAPTSSSPDP